jgi:hypothetical protein
MSSFGIGERFCATVANSFKKSLFQELNGFQGRHTIMEMMYSYCSLIAQFPDLIHYVKSKATLSQQTWVTGFRV